MEAKCEREYAGDEEYALLSPSSVDDAWVDQDEPKGPTPLPIFQVTILLVLQLAEPITATCIYPFINEVCLISTC